MDEKRRMAMTLDEYVKDLTGRAEVEVEWSKPAKLYIRSADSLFKQVYLHS